jgi:hypothetical protein
MAVAEGAGVAAGYGDIYARNASNGISATADVVAAAIASNTIQVANESWHRQYDRFLDIFA